MYGTSGWTGESVYDGRGGRSDRYELFDLVDIDDIFAIALVIVKVVIVVHTTGDNSSKLGGRVADNLRDVASLLLRRLWHQRRIISVRSAHPEVPRWIDGHRWT